MLSDKTQDDVLNEVIEMFVYQQDDMFLILDRIQTLKENIIGSTPDQIIKEIEDIQNAFTEELE